MSWRYKDPKTFPADFARVTRQATASPESWVVLGPAPNYSSAMGICSKFRWWKWCVVQKPGVDLELSSLLSKFSLRARAVRRYPNYIIEVRAREDVIGTIAALNPALAPIIEEIRQ